MEKNIVLVIVAVVIILIICSAVAGWWFFLRKPAVTQCPANSVFPTTPVSAKASASCPAGTKGTRFATCKADGTFTSEDQSGCVPTACAATPVFPSTLIGNTSSVVCPTGFTGNQSSVCQTDGTFSVSDTSKCIPIVSGRYVRIRQPTKGCLNVAEIKVMSAGVNVAAGKPVTMSSAFGGSYPGSMLVDGVLTNFAHTSCNEPGWMLIDLASNVSIDSIVVYNRSDCCSARTVGAIVEVLDSDSTVVWVSDAFADKNGGTTYGDSGALTGISTYTLTMPSKKAVGV